MNKHKKGQLASAKSPLLEEEKGKNKWSRRTEAPEELFPWREKCRQGWPMDEAN